ncbi:hypothetical protein CR956_01820, partial [Candidatus Saccharibacteria bacterium]
NSFYDHLQGQYNEVDNVNNSRQLLIESCDPAISIATKKAGKVGTSSCSIIGKFIQTNDDATSITSVPVVATKEISSIDESQSETDIINSMSLKAYAPMIGEEPNKYKLLWNASVVNDTDGDVRRFSMLLVRSPFSNVVKTYIAEGKKSLKDTINAPKAKLNLCIKNGGLTSKNMGVSVNPNGANSSAVQITPAGSCG